MRKLATLLAASAAIATVTATSPANASASLPPPAWECTAEVTGVEVNHQDLSPVANTLAVHEITGVVVCEADGVVHHAPDEYLLTPYAGGISLHVDPSNADDEKCGGSDLSNNALGYPGTGVDLVSAGPTLVMTGVGTCVWPSTDDPVTYRVHMYWSTHDLAGGNVTIAEKVATVVI